LFHDGIALREWLADFANLLYQIDRSFGAIEGRAEGDAIRHVGTTQNKYLAAVGVFPELHRPLFRLAEILRLPNPAERPIAIAQEQIGKKVLLEDGDEADDLISDAPQSFLTKIVKAERAGKVERRHMVDAIGANIGAGSDTTGITLSAALYYVYRTPHVLAALREEIDNGAQHGQISDPVTFAEAGKMPYLQATIQEVLRMHPAIGYILPRVVPEGGAEIAGKWFPAGVSLYHHICMETFLH
jgi:hypothetical protein